MAPGSVSGGCTLVHRWCGRYPITIDLSAEEGKKEPTFSPAQAWRQSTYAFYRPLCSVFYSRGGGRLPTVSCVGCYIGISMAFRGGDSVRYPPPLLSGGSRLNNSTCSVEKKKSATPAVAVHFLAEVVLFFILLFTSAKKRMLSSLLIVRDLRAGMGGSKVEKFFFQTQQVKSTYQIPGLGKVVRELEAVKAEQDAAAEAAFAAKTAVVAGNMS